MDNPSTLTRSSWLLALRGVCGVVFGIIALARPVAAVWALLVIFGAWALVDGVLAIATGLRRDPVGRHHPWLVVEGILGVVVAGLVWFRPVVSAVALVVMVAVWAVASGIAEIAAAIAFRKTLRGEGWLALAGVASILFGVVLFARPAAGVIALATLVGIYAIIFGIAWLFLAARIHRLGNERRAPRAGAGPAVPTPI